jgi:hypothetical protein
LTAWERKKAYLEFPHLELDHQRAYFDQLTYILSQKNLLENFLQLNRENGGSQIHHFTFQRQERE